MLRIAGKTFDLHLFTGTGKFVSSQLVVEATRACSSQLVILTMKHVNLRQHSDAILEPLIAAGMALLPNTSEVKTTEEAVFTAHLTRGALDTGWLKPGIYPDACWLLPGSIETLKVAGTLVQQGFIVLPYCGIDSIPCKYLEEAGYAAVVPLGAPIGSNQGPETRVILETIIQQVIIPVVVGVDISVLSHAMRVPKMRADAVLANTVIAIVGDPVNVAKILCLAVGADLLTCRSGPDSRNHSAHTTGPLTGFLEISG